MQAGLEGFVGRHVKELAPLPHTKERCALPGYWLHESDSPKPNYPGYVNMACAVKHEDLIRMANMGKADPKANPLVVYDALENAVKSRYPHVRMAFLPGRAGDILFHVQPYGRRAEELAPHLVKTLQNGEHAFYYGMCLGFFRAAVGLDEKGNQVLYIDTIQSEGGQVTSYSSPGHEAEHTLPGGLRKMYMDGKEPGVKAWHDEGLTAIEEACKSVGIPVAIPTWEGIRRYADLRLPPDSAASKVYNSLGNREYSESRLRIRFSQHVHRIRERQGNVWVKVPN